MFAVRTAMLLFPFGLFRDIRGACMRQGSSFAAYLRSPRLRCVRRATLEGIANERYCTLRRRL